MSAPSTEKGAMQQVIRALKADGWTLYSVDGGEGEVKVMTEKQAIAELSDFDLAKLTVTRGGEAGWVLFVFGNEPDETAADYTVNLTVVDALIDKWISA